MLDRELFPREVTGHAPRITLTGTELLHVEQHRGLVRCEADEIGLRTVCGLLWVTGKALRFRHYSAMEAIIDGEIRQITLTPEGRRS